MVARGNLRSMVGPQRLLLPGVRLINREVGASSRTLPNAWLARPGVTVA